jgi:hypothetical protein
MNIVNFDATQAYNAYQYVIRSIKHDYGYSWGIFQAKRLIKRYDDKDLIPQDLRAHGLPIRSFFISHTITTPKTDYNILLVDCCLESLFYAGKIAEITESLQSLGLSVTISDNLIEASHKGKKLGFVVVSNVLTYGHERYSIGCTYKTKSTNSVIKFFRNAMQA